MTGATDASDSGTRSGALVGPEALIAELREIEDHLAARFVASATSTEIDAAETEAFGKKSPLSSVRSRLGSLEPDHRRRIGALLGEATGRLRTLFDHERARIDKVEKVTRYSAERRDLTEVLARFVAGHSNLVTQTREMLEDVFIGMGFTVAEGPEAETDWYNFEALNIPGSHPARAMFDTFYLALGARDGSGTTEPPYLLRTHTSPVQIHLMEEQGPPIYAVMPGRTYRRDTPDARHTPIFHQIEGLVVDRGTTFADLAGTIEAFTTAYFGADIHARLRPAYFPFTEPSAEFEITCTICSGSGCRTCSSTGWIELGGCGMVDPAVFEAVGIDPEEWSGFAFGFGIDRCAQMRHGIADMRILPQNDVRFLAQF